MKSLILFFLIMNVAFAEICDPINLVTEKNSPFKEIPVMDQNGSGTCYAFAAAQMVNYHEIKSGQKHLIVHPAWVALVTNRKNRIGSLSNSSPERAIAGLVKEGVCSTAYVKKALSNWAHVAGASEAKFLAMLDTVTAEVHHQGGIKALSDVELKNIFYQKLADQTGPFCAIDPLWSMLTPHIRNLSVLNSETMLRELILPECDKTKKISLPSLISKFAQADRGLSTITLGSLLSIHRAPVSITYCANILGNHSYIGLLPPTKNSNILTKQDCGKHASLIVGRKKIGNQCHYLLRNSWGSAFNSASRNAKCVCRHKKTGQFVDDCEAKTHNNGQYTVDSCWIPSHTINQNMIKMDVLSSQLKLPNNYNFPKK